MAKLNHVLIDYGKIEKVKIKNKVANVNLYLIKLAALPNQTLKKDEIQTICNKYVKDLAKRGQKWRFQVVVKSEKTGKWLSGKSSKGDEDVQMFEANEENYTADVYTALQEETEFKKFEIIFRPVDDGLGSDDKYNNCVWRVIAQSYKGVFPSRLQKINKPWKFKKYFGLEADEKFPKSKLQELSELINKQIRVTGDETEIYGNNDCKEIINMTSISGHADYVEVKLKRVNNIEYRGISIKPKKYIRVYETNNENESFNVYDEKGYKTLEKEEVYDMKKKTKFSGNHILIKNSTETRAMLGLEEDCDLSEIYKQFKIVADNIKEVSECRIDLYQCGGEIKEYCLYLFNNSFFTEYKMTHVTPQEKDFLINTGGLIYCKEKYEGDIYEYDINSAYTHAMMSDKFTIPITEGEYFEFNQENYKDAKSGKYYFPYGMYKAKVYKSGDIDIDSNFRFAKCDRYTHFDLTRATELDLKIEFHNGINCILYKDRVFSSKLFSEYLTMITEMQSNKELLSESKSTVKKLRNLLWGALTQKNNKMIYPEDDGILTIDEDEFEIIEITPNERNENEYDAYCRVREQPFKHELARLGPFLTSFVRNNLSRTIEKTGQISNIITGHTDSIYSKVKLNLKVSDNIGDYKMKFHKMKIINSMNKICIDKNCNDKGCKTKRDKRGINLDNVI